LRLTGDVQVTFVGDHRRGCFNTARARRTEVRKDRIALRTVQVERHAGDARAARLRLEEPTARTARARQLSRRIGNRIAIQRETVEGEGAVLLELRDGHPLLR